MGQVHVHGFGVAYVGKSVFVMAVIKNSSQVRLKNSRVE